MKKYLYLLILLSLTNCYTYKQPSAENDKSSKAKRIVKSTEITENTNVNLQSIELDNPQKKTNDRNKNLKTNPTNVMEMLETSKFYKIEVGGRSHKIQVDKWESDTLVAHVIHKPKKILKFHKNQINQNTIAERRFSQRTADIITVAAYAGIGVGIWALVQ